MNKKNGTILIFTFIFLVSLSLLVLYFLDSVGKSTARLSAARYSFLGGLNIAEAGFTRALQQLESNFDWNTGYYADIGAMAQDNAGIYATLGTGTGGEIGRYDADILQLDQFSASAGADFTVNVRLNTITARPRYHIYCELAWDGYDPNDVNTHDRYNMILYSPSGTELARTNFAGYDPKMHPKKLIYPYLAADPSLTVNGNYRVSVTGPGGYFYYLKVAHPDRLNAGYRLASNKRVVFACGRVGTKEMRQVVPPNNLLMPEIANSNAKDEQFIINPDTLNENYIWEIFAANNLYFRNFNAATNSRLRLRGDVLAQGGTAANKNFNAIIDYNQSLSSRVLISGNAQVGEIPAGTGSPLLGDAEYAQYQTYADNAVDVDIPTEDTYYSSPAEFYNLIWNPFVRDSVLTTEITLPSSGYAIYYVGGAGNLNLDLYGKKVKIRGMIVRRTGATGAITVTDTTGSGILTIEPNTAGFPGCNKSNLFGLVGRLGITVQNFSGVNQGATLQTGGFIYSGQDITVTGVTNRRTNLNSRLYAERDIILTSQGINNVDLRVLDKDMVFACRGNNTTTFYGYSPAADTWENLNIGETPVFNTGGAVCWAARDALYYLRGNSTDFFRYSFFSNDWTALSSISGANVGAGASLCWVRENIRTGNKEYKDYVYALSGNNTTPLKKYSVSDDTWADVSNAPAAIGAGGALCWTGGDYLYVLRGNNSRTFWRYSISQNTWTALTNTSAAVGAGGGLTSGGKDILYCLRGANTRNFYRYTISTNSWQSLADFGSAGDNVGNGGSLFWEGLDTSSLNVRFKK